MGAGNQAHYTLNWQISHSLLCETTYRKPMPATHHFFCRYALAYRMLFTRLCTTYPHSFFILLHLLQSLPFIIVIFLSPFFFFVKAWFLPRWKILSAIPVTCFGSNLFFRYYFVLVGYQRDQWYWRVFSLGSHFPCLSLKQFSSLCTKRISWV